MNETTDLVIPEKPDIVVIKGRDAAAELTKIVSSREKKLVMAGKQYLFFEDWQTIGKFYGVTAKVVYTEELKDEGKLIGFLAKAVAIHDNQEVSGADAECTYDEPNWQSKPRFQLRSMAQTRACAKALRNCLGWVAVLAGYEATPAEEISDEPKTTEHWCPIHNVPFFKKGKMKSYAHPIEGTDPVEWCHEQTETAPEVIEPSTEPVEIGEQKPEPTIKTIQALLNWVASHGKKFDRSWVLAAFSFDEKKMHDDPYECYLEIKQMMDW